jgi:hypothetical protein
MKLTCSLNPCLQRLAQSQRESRRISVWATIKHSGNAIPEHKNLTYSNRNRKNHGDKNPSPKGKMKCLMLANAGIQVGLMVKFKKAWILALRGNDGNKIDSGRRVKNLSAWDQGSFSYCRFDGREKSFFA